MMIGMSRTSLVLVAIMAVAIGALLMLGVATQPQHTTTELKYLYTTSVTNNSLGIKLTLSLTNTTFGANQSVRFLIALSNVLPYNNTLTPASHWTINETMAAPCGSNFPFDFGVFRGIFTSSNVTSATPLTLYDPTNTYYCPQIVPVHKYVFQPNIDTMTVFAGFGNQSNAFSPFGASYTWTLNGYWTAADQKVGLGLGGYTIFVQDEWGDLLFGHFIVQ